MKDRSQKVYFALGVDGDALGLVKIGMSRDPHKRVNQLRASIGRFSLLGWIPGGLTEERTVQGYCIEAGAPPASGREYFSAEQVQTIVKELLQLSTAVVVSRSFDPKDYPEDEGLAAAREFFQRKGQLGGRPRVVPHIERLGVRWCPCIDCRRKRGAVPKGKYPAVPEGGGGGGVREGVKVEPKGAPPDKAEAKPDVGIATELEKRVEKKGGRIGMEEWMGLPRSEQSRRMRAGKGPVG